MSGGHLFLRRLRIMHRGTPVYDQAFHLGVNIIRGSNSTGKSTIADAIYFVLGGEFGRWKGAAKLCDEVQAEIEITDGVLTVRREMGKPTSIPQVFFGPMTESIEHGLDSWHPHPLHRTDRQESYSQLMFRSIGIPEARSDGASNITMHQILRLLYSDQRTPTGHLFGFESFDRSEIRVAVGDLLCGLSPFEAYQTELELRALRKDFDDKRLELRALVAGLPDEEVFRDLDGLNLAIRQKEQEVKNTEKAIEQVDLHISDSASSEFNAARAKALKVMSNLKQKVGATERQLESIEFDLAELEQFLKYLEDLDAKANLAGKVADIIGEIDFITCPSCLKPLPDRSDISQCRVCGQSLADGHEESKYLVVRRDLEIQLRESSQLKDTKCDEQQALRSRLRNLRSDLQEAQSNFVLKHDLSSSPREAFLAERNWKIGALTKEIEQLNRMVSRAQEVRRVSDEKEAVQSQITEKEERLKVLALQAGRIRANAMALVNEYTKQFLMRDLPDQDDFRNPREVIVDFENNVIKVDGEINFSESSNVVLKNAAVLAIHAAAATSESFNHPRFILMDNIEDKGMTQERSRNFQNVIVQASEEAQLEHQIIFATSMVDPKLEADKYTIGPAYTSEHKTLTFPKGVRIIDDE
jgi:predicted  nucleic acid-binding Zn-ribbon protein